VHGVELGQALACRLTAVELFGSALKDASRSELLQLEPLDGIGHFTLSQFDLQLTRRECRVLGCQCQIVEVRAAALRIVGSPGGDLEFASAVIDPSQPLAFKKEHLMSKQFSEFTLNSGARSNGQSADHER
jgi:hypothetical protein